MNQWTFSPNSHKQEKSHHHHHSTGTNFLITCLLCNKSLMRTSFCLAFGPQKVDSIPGMHTFFLRDHGPFFFNSSSRTSRTTCNTAIITIPEQSIACLSFPKQIIVSCCLKQNFISWKNFAFCGFRCKAPTNLTMQRWQKSLDTLPISLHCWLPVDIVIGSIIINITTTLIITVSSAVAVMKGLQCGFFQLSFKWHSITAAFKLTTFWNHLTKKRQRLPWLKKKSQQTVTEYSKIILLKRQGLP